MSGNKIINEKGNYEKFDQIQFLAEKWKRTEDDDVLAELVVVVLPKLETLVYSLFPKSVIKEDLVAVGLADIKEALQKYEITTNDTGKLQVKFLTYYSRRATGIMRHTRRDTETTIRVSRHSSDLVVKYHSFSNKYFNKHGKYPSNEEAAKAIKVTEDALTTHLKLNKNIRDGFISLSRVNEENLDFAYTFPFDSDASPYTEVIEELVQLVKDGASVLTVARKLGCTKKKAEDALKKIQKYMDETLDDNID